MSEIIHYPNLKTVLMVEKILKEADDAISKNEIKKRLPTKIMHQTLNVILDYLQSSNKIVFTRNGGAVWIYNDNPKFLEMIRKGVEVETGKNGLVFKRGRKL